MAQYKIIWEIELDADSPLEAARQALEIHRDKESSAVVFDVGDELGECTRVDLLDAPEEPIPEPSGKAERIVEILRIRELISGVVEDLVSDFLYYDRKEDEELPEGAVEQAIEDGHITVDQIVARFKYYLEEGL